MPTYCHKYKVINRKSKIVENFFIFFQQKAIITCYSDSYVLLRILLIISMIDDVPCGTFV